MFGWRMPYTSVSVLMLHNIKWVWQKLFCWGWIRFYQIQNKYHALLLSRRRIDMATTRKDLRGRTLRKGEMQRSSINGMRIPIKIAGAAQIHLRKWPCNPSEGRLNSPKDRLDCLDIYVAGKATVNFVFDRYMSLKRICARLPGSNYLYMYDRFVRDTFGKKKIAVIRYSDVLQFYNYLLDKQDLQVNTLESVHTLLHPTFQLAVRDEIIGRSPPMVCWQR